MSSLKRKSPVPLREGLDLDTKNSKLLHLPQSDLKRSTRPNLILMSMPPAKSEESNQVMQAMKEGKCSILTNEKSSALVLPDSSYNLTMIGTSNTLVVYQSKKEPSSSTNDTTESSNNGNISEDSKKQKLDDRQACRLIQPGGSGASFLSLSKNQIKPQDIEALLKSPASGSNNQQQSCYTADELSLALQCSVAEVEQALELLPCAGLPSSNHQDPPKFRLWTDEEYWNAKRALVEMLCEEVDAEDEDLPPEQFAELVAQRIVLPDNENDEYKGDDASKWKLAMSKQMIRLGTKASSTDSSSSSSRRYWDKQMISKWALQDLVLTSRQSTWPLEELLSTWQSRLPLLWCNDRIPAPNRQEEETEESEPVDDTPLGGETDAGPSKDVATRQALEAMSEVKIFIPEGNEKKNATDTGDKEMVELEF